MFTVKTPEEVFAILQSEFIEAEGGFGAISGNCPKECSGEYSPAPQASERVPLSAACGRILAHDILANEYVPGFNRSTVDGYAVSAVDTFGCSEAIPAILELLGEVQMGEAALLRVSPGSCIYVPTGGAVPEGADAMVMVEYTEDYGDGTIGILKSVAPGANMIYRGDDVFPGKPVLGAGRKLTASDIGALAAMGITEVPVHKRPIVGIISTGDELVPVSEIPGDGQVRDVNSAMLDALCKESGARTRLFGIIPDDLTNLTNAVEDALGTCDMVLISGGSSVGTKDMTARIIEAHGKLLFHGIAMKPGKPTILGNAGGKPVFGLPGHPVAAYFVTHLFVRYLLTAGRSLSNNVESSDILARLSEAISANHGRAEYIPVRLRIAENGGKIAVPIHGKSGLISLLAGADGYICIPRDCEGLPAGASVAVQKF